MRDALQLNLLTWGIRPGRLKVSSNSFSLPAPFTKTKMRYQLPYITIKVAPTDFIFLLCCAKSRGSLLLYQLLLYQLYQPSYAAVTIVIWCCTNRLSPLCTKHPLLILMLSWVWERTRKGLKKEFEQHLEVLTSCWTTRHLAALIHRVKNVQFDYRSVTGGTIDRCLATPSDPPFLIEGYYRSKIEASS